MRTKKARRKHRTLSRLKLLRADVEYDLYPGYYAYSTRNRFPKPIADTPENRARQAILVKIDELVALIKELRMDG